MKFLIVISSLVMFAGCKSSKPSITTVIKDSIILKDTTIYKTTVLYTKGDTIKVIRIVPCPEARFDTVIKKGKTEMKASLQNGVLDIECNADSLQHIIDSVTRLKQKEVYHTERVEVPVDKPVPYIPKWVWYLLGAFILLAGWSFRKPLISIIKSKFSV